VIFVVCLCFFFFFFFFSSRRRHTRSKRDWSSDVCSSDLEGFEYWTFSAPWLVHFLDAWEHSTGESLWDRDVFRNWKLYVAHSIRSEERRVGKECRCRWWPYQ